MYKVAIIGSGRRAPAHIEAYRHVPEATVVAVCDRTGTRSGELANKYGIRAYTDAVRMIEEQRPHLVHIVTMPNARVELMQLVADLGVPLCTVEKPVALGVANWRALKQLEASSRTKFAVSHQFRWQPHLSACREAIGQGRLGEVQLLHLSTASNIADQGTHILDYGMSLIDNSPVTELFGNASGWRDDNGHPSPDSSVAYLTFANGVRAVWSTGPMSPLCGDPKLRYQHMQIAAYAERGRTLYQMFGKWEIVAPDGSEQGDCGGVDGWRANDLLSQASFHQSMFTWLETGRAPGTNLYHSLHEWEVVLALYQSALERRSIRLAEFDPPDNLPERMKTALSGGGRQM